MVNMKQKKFYVKRSFKNLINAMRAESFRYFSFPMILPSSVLLATTYMCNSRCRICNIWKRYHDNHTSIKNELTLDEFTTFVEKNNFLTKIAITGGEPFLRKDLYDIVLFLDKKGYNTDILTNGIFLNKIKRDETKILQNLSGGIPHSFSVSFDGLGPTHDHLRGMHGLFNRAVILLKWAMKQKKKYDFLSVSVSHTITESNYKELNSFVDYFVKFGLRPEQISFRIAQQSFYFNNMKREETLNDIYGLVKQLQKLQEKYEFFKKDFFHKKMIQFLFHPRKLIIPCAATFSFCYIDPYWNVYPCIQWEEKLGNLKEFDLNLKSFWRSKTMKKTRELIKNGNCPNCWTQCSAIPSMNANIPALLQRHWNSIKYI